MKKRVILIVLDSAGVGEMFDAAAYGDEGSNTLGHIYESIRDFSLPNMEKLGLLNIGFTDIKEPEKKPKGAYGKAAEMSKGKDTTTGHFELSGVVLSEPFRVYHDGFPEKIIKEFEEKSGYKTLCNKPYSGTEVIKDYGDEHMQSGALIVYTSADSVFQIAANENKIPLNELYRVCKIARAILDPYNVSRVIARPFIKTADGYKRTENRRDFSMEPPDKTMLDTLKENGYEVAGVGKIDDIFSGRGLTSTNHTKNNDAGIDAIIEYMQSVKKGLIFANLVDFDTLYGHRNDAEGYGNALKHFDKRLLEILRQMRDEDMLIITADHGCDPTTKSTDHSREYVPVIAYGKKINPKDLGTRDTYADIAASICEYFGVDNPKYGVSFLEEILEDK